MVRNCSVGKHMLFIFLKKYLFFNLASVADGVALIIRCSQTITKQSLMLLTKKEIAECQRLECVDCLLSASVRFCLIIIIFNLIDTTLSAEGFRNSPVGAFSLGRAGGRIAQIYDSSAATHNPANLTLINSPEVSFDPTFVYYSVKYKNGNIASHTIDPWKILPNLHAALPLGDTNLVFGLGVTVPYGLSVVWEKNGPFRYTAPHFNELQTMNVNPSLGLQVSERVSVGMGLDAMWSKLRLRQFYPWAMVLSNPSIPDGELAVSGDGIGWGGNAAVSVQISPTHRAAVTVRFPLDVDYSGDFLLSGIPPAVSSLFPSTGLFKSQISFPTIVGLGYGINISPTIQIEADFEWLEFSRYERLPLILDTAIPGIPSQMAQNWQNSFTVGIAGEWKLLPRWRLRSGYQYYRTPVPDMTFSPSIPDSDQHAVTVGLAYSVNHHSFETAYSRVFYVGREIGLSPNPQFSGQYSMEVHLISVSYRYRF